MAECHCLRELGGLETLQTGHLVAEGSLGGMSSSSRLIPQKGNIQTNVLHAA